MKRFAIATLFLVGLALVAGSALAEKKDHPAKKADHPSKAAEHPGKGKGHAARMAWMTKKLDLTEEQATKVNGIFKAHHEAAKAQKAKMFTELATVLDEEQMAKFKKIKARKMRKGWNKCWGKFKGLDLSDAQQQEIAKICAEAKTKAKAVLTDEQRQKLQDRRKKGDKVSGRNLEKGNASGCFVGMAKANSCGLGKGNGTCPLTRDKLAI